LEKRILETEHCFRSYFPECTGISVLCYHNVVKLALHDAIVIQLSGLFMLM